MTVPAMNVEQVPVGRTIFVRAPPQWVVGEGGISGVLAHTECFVGVYDVRRHLFWPTLEFVAVSDAQDAMAAKVIDLLVQHDFDMKWYELYFTKAMIYLASAGKTPEDVTMRDVAMGHAFLWSMNGKGGEKIVPGVGFKSVFRVTRAGGVSSVASQIVGRQHER